MTKFARNGLVLFVLATAMSIAGLSGVWVINGADIERIWFGVAELVLIVLLLINGFSIKRWVFDHSNSLLARQVAWLCVLSLGLCVAGDVVNRNFAQLFYQHGSVVKHDYLVDSVLFFAPGYLLLALALWRVAVVKGVSSSFMAVSGGLFGGVGLLSFFGMANFAAGDYVLGITGSYTIVIGVISASGLWLLKAYGGLSAPRSLWLVAIGAILATVADALIGNFWIYGNNGEGFFPAISHINWIVYFGSQALVQQLPLLVAADQNPAV